ncbi:hypothetical protein [Photobacterium carnosum]|uniref:hypothetical protein n=1 Tax=Photobacterium carnosum TaxID=2023717 RepID=UPI001E2EBE2E|nr:hypothetical protein [Photobacterium carnosum]
MTPFYYIGFSGLLLFTATATQAAGIPPKIPLAKPNAYWSALYMPTIDKPFIVTRRLRSIKQ